MTESVRELLDKAAQSISAAELLLKDGYIDFSASRSYYAGEILEREEVLHLSERDSQTFLAALENPPEPSLKLIEAMKSHSRLINPA